MQLAWAAHLTQQHGFLHGGILGAALDSARGYAASSLMPADVGVLSIEYKINFVASARGQRFRMAATMSATMMAVAGRDDVKS